MKVKTLTRSKPKYKMKGRTKARTKAISMILILSLCLASVIQPLSISAGELGTSSTQTETEAGAFTPVQSEAISAEKVVLKSADLKKTKDAVVLQYIGEEQFDRANHTMRLKQHEDLHTFVFQNLDGTRTMYVMDEDVKYINTNGETIDKDISLVSKTKGFGIVQNEVDLLIPNSVQNGIDVEYNGYAIKLTPQGLVTRASAKQEDNSVVYEGAFGTNTSLKYTPLLSGIKEDIILSSYMSNVSYKFELETDGLRVRQNEGRYYLVDPAKKDPVFHLGEILVYDAIGKPDMGTMTVTTVEEGQKYLLTITVDDEFLSDPTTEYPVTIDPSITISDSIATGSIEDAPIFENYPNTNFGTYAYNRVGTPSAAYGVGRTVVRLRGLIDSSEYQNITASQVVAASFYVTEASGGAPQTVELYPLLNTTWTETNVKWSNVGECSTAIDPSSAQLSYNREAQFDITNLVQAWKNGTLNAEAGFILKHTNESLNKAICSSEFSTTSKRPRVVVTYTSTLVISPSQVSIQLHTAYLLHAIHSIGGGEVSWSSSDTNVAEISSVGLLSAKRLGSTLITATLIDDNGDEHYAYCTVNVEFLEGEYYIRNKQSGYYADIYGATIGTWNSISQWEFLGTQTAKWIFEDVGDGYFTIRINKSTTPYYLSVDGDSTTAYSEIFLRSGTITNGMKWKIEVTQSGAYKLIPKTGESSGYVLATAPTSFAPGEKLQQLSYTNDNIYQDEWVFSKQVISLVNYYDETFAQNDSMRSKIALAISFASQVYSKQFGVDICMLGAPSYAHFGIEDCSYDSTCDYGNGQDGVGCGQDCRTQHHKNIHRISDAIYNSNREDDHIYVLWTDREANFYCSEVGENNHETVSGLVALVYDYRPVIHFLNIHNGQLFNPENEGEGQDIELACMAITLVHEIAHTLGMYEAYDNTDHDTPRKMFCVMEEFEETGLCDFYDSLLNGGDPFCQSCTDAMRGYTSYIFIEGNMEGGQ